MSIFKFNFVKKFFLWLKYTFSFKKTLILPLLQYTYTFIRENPRTQYESDLLQN